MKKMLVVYYSWSNGNTEKIALSLQKATGAELVTSQGKIDKWIEEVKKSL